MKRCHISVILAAMLLLTGCGGTSSAGSAEVSKQEASSAAPLQIADESSKEESSQAQQTTAKTEPTTTAATTTTAVETETTASLPEYAFHCDRLDADIEIDAESDVPEEYIDRCVDFVKNLSGDLHMEICKGGKRYCMWMIEQEKEAMGDDFTAEEEYEKVDENTSLTTIARMMDFTGMYIEVPEDENVIAFSIGGECDWEPEHGLDVLIRDGKVIYVGSCEGYSPWDTDYYTEEEGKEWNFALQ